MIFSFKENDIEYSTQFDRLSKISFDDPKCDFKTIHTDHCDTDGNALEAFSGKDILFKYLNKIYDEEKTYARIEIDGKVLEAQATYIDFGEEIYTIGPFDSEITIGWNRK